MITEILPKPNLAEGFTLIVGEIRKERGLRNNSLLSGSGLMVCKKLGHWASLVVQWLRISLPMQGTRVRALVWEDPTCRGATGPVSHNC